MNNKFYIFNNHFLLICVCLLISCGSNNNEVASNELQPQKENLLAESSLPKTQTFFNLPKLLTTSSLSLDFKLSDFFEITSTKGATTRYFGKAADYNGDGFPDIAVGMISQESYGLVADPNPILFFTQNNLGQFTNSTHALNSDSKDIISTSELSNLDLNGDGKTDLLLAQGGLDVYINGQGNGVYSGSPSILYLSEGNGFNISDQPKGYSAFYHFADVADINNDGFPDAILLGTPKGSIIMINDGKGHLIPRPDFTPKELIDQANLNETLEIYSSGWIKTQRQSHLVTALFIDINRDGFKDLYVMGYGPYQYAFLNDGNGDFTKNMIRVNDPNGGDFLATYPPSPSGNAISFIAKTHQVYWAAALDINGDGWEDLITISTYNNLDNMNRNSSEITHTGSFINILINTPNSFVDETKARLNVSTFNTQKLNAFDKITTLDLNGDGKLDFLITRTAYTDSKTTTPGFKDNLPSTIFFLNDGAGHFSQYTVPGLADNNFYPIPISGKLGLAGISDVNGKSTTTGKYQFSTWTSLIPFTKGNSGNNFLYGTDANDLIDGGDGIDVYQPGYRYKKGAFTLNNNSISIKGTVGDNDTLINVERIKFLDTSFAVDVNGNAGKVAKILGAVFGASSISNKQYVGIGLSLLDSGMSYSDLGALAINTAGASNADAIVTLLWKNVIGTTPQYSDKQPFIDMLNNGTKIGDLVVLAAETSYNLKNINYSSILTTGIEYTPTN